MFQTEPIQFLQSFAGEWLTFAMVLVSRLGDSGSYIAVLMLITFGVSFRKGFLLTQAMLWMGIVTALLKNVIGLPRPFHVDAAVSLPGSGGANSTPFRGMGGTGFWELPDPGVIRAVRAVPGVSFGLPSGHVTGAVTFWGGLWLLFRRRTIGVAAVAMLVLMPLSRMYLGLHFLADVLGGLVLGAALLTVIHVGFVGPGTAGRLLALSRLARRPGVWAGSTALLLAPCLLLLLNSVVTPVYAGQLLGLNAGFLLVAVDGLPDDRASWPRRAARIVVALGLFLASSWIVDRGTELISLDARNLWVIFVTAALPAFAGLWGGVRCNTAFGLFGRQNPPSRRRSRTA